MFNTLYEYVGNLHMHTPYSDGEGTYADIVSAAADAGLDFVVATDHNVLVQGVEGYHGDDDAGYVLLLTGEEVHDQNRWPQINHLLVYGVEGEISQCAPEPQQLIDSINGAGGLSFIAHPNDLPLDWLNFEAIPWQDWSVQRFTGLEIWNYMSSFKATGVGTKITGPLRLLRSALNPDDHILAPPPETLALWDKLLTEGLHVVGIGGSDAHAFTVKVGPFQRCLFPYKFLFSRINTHVLLTQPLSGDLIPDKQAIYKALQQGNVFIAYDLIGNTKGFRFSAQGQQTTTIMGGVVKLGSGVTLQAKAPDLSRMKMIYQGEVVAESHGRENLMYVARQPGAYRVEAWRNYRGKEYAWILSNPIYVEDTPVTSR